MIDDDGGELAAADKRVCACARVRKRVCILLIGSSRARPRTCVLCARNSLHVRARSRAHSGCVSARARGHDDFGKHGASHRPMAAHLLADRATAIRDDEERGSETEEEGRE